MATILGLAGGPNMWGTPPHFPGLHELFFHDAAAALVVDGRIVHAVEEERITRVKHTNCFPAAAARACLEQSGIAPEAVDTFAYFFEEEFCDVEFRRVAADLGIIVPQTARALIAANLAAALRFPCSPDHVRFVKHHEAHAAAAYRASTFDECLIAVIDGRGETESVTIARTCEGKIESLGCQPVRASPGFFYRQVTRLLGFGQFDEYKVMGLAPYGDPKRFQHLLAQLYRAARHGTDEVVLDFENLPRIALAAGLPPRDRDGAITQDHKDFAAAAQALLERVCLDLLGAWRLKTGLRHLCLVGGVAHNCRMNGMVARSGLFDAIYVHPASHDAGAAIGAALNVAAKPKATGVGTFSPFLGTMIHLEGAAEQGATLHEWSHVLVSEEPADLHAQVATAIAAGQIVGWARGRAEFGPRALGARSILADPRPRENWTRINRAIKKREAFRPFAPAVCEESASKYFILPDAHCNLGEMCFTVDVRQPWRATLAAITHVDGSARIQLVSRERSEDFWQLIRAFEKVTGIGVVLNTSFNHSSEPIVDTPRDAVRTFLTTDLDLLVLGPHLVRKQRPVADAVRMGHVILARGAEVVLRLSNGEGGGDRRSGCIVRESKRVHLSAGLAAWFINMPNQTGRGGWSMADVLHGRSADEANMLVDEVCKLWESRLIDVLPGPRL